MQYLNNALFGAVVVTLRRQVSLFGDEGRFRLENPLCLECTVGPASLYWGSTEGSRKTHLR